MYINSANNNLYFFSTASHLHMHVCIIVFLECKMEIIWPEILSWENTKFRNQIVFVLSWDPHLMCLSVNMLTLSPLNLNQMAHKRYFFVATGT